jgi:hypothetical protein
MASLAERRPGGGGTRLAVPAVVLSANLEGRFDALVMTADGEWHIVLDEALSGFGKRRAIALAVRLVKEGRQGFVRTHHIQRRTA